MSYISKELFYWKLGFFFCFAAMLIFSNDIAFADAATNDDIIGKTLCQLVSNLSGGIARSIATIAVFAVGVGLFLGKINWGIAAATTAGIAIVFGAQDLVKWLAPGGNDSWSGCDDPVKPG